MQGLPRWQPEPQSRQRLEQPKLQLGLQSHQKLELEWRLQELLQRIPLQRLELKWLLELRILLQRLELQTPQQELQSPQRLGLGWRLQEHQSLQIPPSTLLAGLSQN